MRINFCSLSPGPFPPRCAGGRGTFFLWGFAGGRSPPAKPLFFSPPPRRRMRRRGGGRGWGKSYSSQRFIHRQLDTWRQAENHRTFSCLDEVRQHMASPRKIGEPAKKRIGESANRRIGESQNHVHDKGGANFSSLAGRRPGMNSGADRSSSLKRAPKQRASARLARVEPASRRSLRLLLTTHDSHFHLRWCAAGICHLLRK